MNIWIKSLFFIIAIIVCSYLLTTKSHFEANQLENYFRTEERQTGTSQEKSISIIVTAYSSTPDQTDGNPFVTASGIQVRDGIIAANFLAFGARVRFPELYQDKIFTVEDRMNSEYEYRVDIWFPTRHEALQFGVRETLMEILPSIIELR